MGNKKAKGSFWSSNLPLPNAQMTDQRRKFFQALFVVQGFTLAKSWETWEGTCVKLRQINVARKIHTGTLNNKLKTGTSGHPNQDTKIFQKRHVIATKPFIPKKWSERWAWDDFDLQFVVVCLKSGNHISGAVRDVMWNALSLQGALSHQHSFKPTAGTDHFVQNTVLYQWNVIHSVCCSSESSFQQLSEMYCLVSGSSPKVVPFWVQFLYITIRTHRHSFC